MSVSKALSFVNFAIEDKELRDLCSIATSKEFLLDVLGFNETEFEDAINMKLVRCQSYDQAADYQQLKTWFSMI